MSRESQAGFAFLEAVVAAVIVAGVVGLMAGVTADGAIRSRSAEIKSMGLLVAESRLACAGTEIPLSRGVVEGVEGPFFWRVMVSPYRLGPGRSMAGNAYLVTVVVRPRTGTSNAVELRSLRLAPQG